MWGDAEVRVGGVQAATVQMVGVAVPCGEGALPPGVACDYGARLACRVGVEEACVVGTARSHLHEVG